MATRHIDAEGAFALLRTTSQELNIKLRVVAEDVALTGALPDSGS
jgi:AmiR/NasT family two-component response regulator